jgi:molybdenum cofactor guanylyltransferase
MINTAGIILAGGHSRRMGADKATLRFGPETLLERMVSIVSQAAAPVVVVTGAHQPLPPLPTKILVTRDEKPDRGPLEGIAAGLRVLQQSFSAVEAAYITGCDTPLLTAAFIRRMAELLENQYEATVPLLDSLPQPLAGVYRIRILPVVESLLADDRRAVHQLFERIAVRLVPADELRDVDPDLKSLRNVNTPEDYQAALAIAKLAKDNRPL